MDRAAVKAELDARFDRLQEAKTAFAQLVDVDQQAAARMADQLAEESDALAAAYEAWRTMPGAHREQPDEAER